MSGKEWGGSVEGHAPSHGPANVLYVIGHGRCPVCREGREPLHEVPGLCSVDGHPTCPECGTEYPIGRTVQEAEDDRHLRPDGGEVVPREGYSGLGPDRIRELAERVREEGHDSFATWLEECASREEEVSFDG